MRNRVVACLGITVLLLAGSSAAREVKEHPLIRPYPGSVLGTGLCDHRSFDAYEFVVTDPLTGRPQKKTVKGEFYKLLYEVKTESGARVKNISTLEFLENYKAAALERGGAVQFEDRGRIVLTIPREDGGVTWLDVKPQGNLGQQYLFIVDEAPFEKTLVFGPAELKAALDRDGRVVLHGILFDLDRDTLQLESDRQLQHVARLLLDDPDLRLEVQGHTDDQGAEEYNLDLSQRRAATVHRYLQLFGVAADRLKPRGYGESAPVAPNTTEEGRAQNRRVELVKF